MAANFLKPETIYLSDNNGKDEMVAKIGDYRILTLKQADLAKEKQISGTPFYIAPEMFTNPDGAQDKAKDIWALGVILYEMCSLKKPFVAKTLPALSLKIVDSHQ